MKPAYDKSIRQKIAQLALDSDLSATQMGKQLGVSQGTIYYWMKQEKKRRAKTNEAASKRVTQRLKIADAERQLKIYSEQATPEEVEAELESLEEDIEQSHIESNGEMVRIPVENDVKRELLNTKFIALIRIQILVNKETDLDKMAKIVQALNTFKTSDEEGDKEGKTWFENVNDLMNKGIQDITPIK